LLANFNKAEFLVKLGCYKVREAAAAEKKRLEDELIEEKCKAVEATAQFNTMATGRSNLCVNDPF
jgi:hypothetical protein